jgi:hypothetical protein
MIRPIPVIKVTEYQAVHGPSFEWDLHSYDDRLMTPERFVAGSFAVTEEAAYEAAYTAWEAHTAREDFQAVHHEDTDAVGGWAP